MYFTRVTKRQPNGQNALYTYVARGLPILVNLFFNIPDPRDLSSWRVVSCPSGAQLLRDQVPAPPINVLCATTHYETLNDDETHAVAARLDKLCAPVPLPQALQEAMRDRPFSGSVHNQESRLVQRTVTSLMQHSNL